MTGEETAQHLADEGRVALRLVRLTQVFKEPNEASPVVEILPEGAVVTVAGDAGTFLYVIIASDRFGYIADSTPVVASSREADTILSASDAEGRARSRDALIFTSRLEDEAERAKQQPVSNPSMMGVASAAVGLAGLLLAHAVSSMTKPELMVFSGLDVLLPLFILTANPKAPISLYWLAAAGYLALVTGYVAI